MEIRQPNDQEFEEVKKYIEYYWLDNTGLDKEQFSILLQDNKLVAFGRLRITDDATELCTLGVVKEFRGKYHGSAMVKALLKQAQTDVHVVTVIPDFFLKLGFTQVEEYPVSIAKKHHLCSTEYVVDEPYVVMKYSPLVIA